MMLNQQLWGRNITAAVRRSPLISRLRSTIGSQSDAEVEKNKPRVRNDNSIRRAASLGGGNESRHRTRTSNGMIEKNLSSSFNTDNLRRLHDTFNRGGSAQHQQRASPSLKRNNYKSNYMPDNADNKQLYHNIIKCKTIQDTVAVAHDNLDKLSPRTTAAVWKHLSLLLSKPLYKSNQHMIDKELKTQLDALLSHTSNQIASHNPIVLTNTAHALASIIKATTMATNNKKHNGSLHQLFHELLNNNANIWGSIQHRYLEMEESFGARQVATLAWSFATVFEPITRNKHTNSSQFNVAPFFNAAHRTFHSKKDEFSTKQMTNIAWACMTCRHSIPELFNELADEFVSRTLDSKGNNKAAEVWDAVTLCQLASSFAKARHNDARLFGVIAHEVIPMLPDFNGRQLANLIQPFAFAKIVPKLGDNGRALFDEVAKESIRQVKSLAPQNMANILWAYATSEHSHPDLFNTIAQEAGPRLKEFSPKQLANLAWALSKYPPTKSKDDIFDQIATEIVNQGLESFTNQGLTMMAHSFATVGHTSHDDFWNVIEDTAIERASQFGHLECVQMAWAFATIERPSKELFRRIERVAYSNIRAFNSQGLSNLSWAFSSLGYDSLPLFQAIAASSMRKMDEFKPKEKAMLALSFSRISHAFPSLFDKVASRSLPELKSFGSLDLFNVVVSYSKADASKRNKKLLKATADEIVCRPSSLSPKMLVGVAYAYANEGFWDPRLFNYISKECLSYCASFDSDEIASLAWSFVSVGCRDRLLLETLAEESNSRWQEFGAQPLANMAWAYATADEERPSDRLSLFEGIAHGIADSAVTIKDDFTAQGVSNLLWAFSAAGCPEQRLFQSLATSASATLHDAAHQSLANIAWAYSVANVDDSSLFNDRFVNSCVEKQHDFDYQGLRQLHQWNLWRQELKSDVTLPKEFANKCRNEFIEQSLIMSDLQRQVASTIHSMGLNPDEEVQTKSGYILDVTFIRNGKVIGLEVDGPTHFVGRKKKGNTILKVRQVANVDLIPIVSVPYWEWAVLHTLEEKERYILDKIDQIERNGS